MNSEVFDFLESCIIIFDPYYKIAYMNSNARNHFDIKEGDDVRQILQPEDRSIFFENLIEILNKDRSYKNFIRLIDKSKKIQFCYLNVFFNKGSIAFEIIVLSGFSKLSLSQRSINYNYLKYISEGIAHVLRNPIMSIGGFLNLIRKKLPNEVKNEIGPYMDSIQGEFSKIMKIILDIEIINNTSELHLESVNIDEFLSERLDIFRLENTTKSITYNCQLSCNLKLFIDKKLLALVIEEILKNAYESIADNGVILVFSNREDNNIIIGVEDNGGGIDKDKIGMLFTPFYSTKPKNVGLGLFISKLIVQSHKGRLRIVSNNNTTTVKMIFPIDKGSRIRIERLEGV